MRSAPPAPAVTTLAWSPGVRDNTRGLSQHRPADRGLIVSTGNFTPEVFSQSVTHANTTIGRGSICLLVVRVEISKFCFTLKVLKVVSGYH